MKAKKEFYGVSVSKEEVASGWCSYATVGNALDAELYSGFQPDEDWELVHGDDMRYYDREGNVYDSEGCAERMEELEYLIQKGKAAGQDTTGMEQDLDFLTQNGEPVRICDYYEISDDAARILMQESTELVFYNREKKTYLWGICFCGINWNLVSTSIPAR